jgi:hypothetical protein
MVGRIDAVRVSSLSTSIAIWTSKPIGVAPHGPSGLLYRFAVARSSPVLR